MNYIIIYHNMIIIYVICILYCIRLDGLRAEKDCDNAFFHGCHLLTRNCELAKVLLASGLQMASVALPETFATSSKGLKS